VSNSILDFGTPASVNRSQITFRTARSSRLRPGIDINSITRLQAAAESIRFHSVRIVSVLTRENNSIDAVVRRQSAEQIESDDFVNFDEFEG
jgi:hypothetical protein